MNIDNEFDPMKESSFTKEKVTKEEFAQIEKNSLIVREFLTINKDILKKWSMQIDGQYNLSIEEKQQYNKVKEEQRNLPEKWNPDMYEAI